MFDKYDYEKCLELLYRGCDIDCMDCELGKQSQCVRDYAYNRLLKSIELLKDFVEFNIDWDFNTNSAFGIITLKNGDSSIDVLDDDDIDLLSSLIY